MTKKNDPAPSPTPEEDLPEIVITPGPPATKRGSGLGRIVSVSPDNPDFVVIEEAADLLLDGGVIALPTDTVYGLACDATNADAVEKIFQLKARERGKPLPLLIDSMRTFGRIARQISPEMKCLLDEFWPGALTVVIPKPADMFGSVTREPSIGVRMPNCTVTLAVISMLARPLAVTSANPSGLPPATSAAMAAEYFGKRVDMILDGGESAGSAVSTVLSLLDARGRILRQGAISRERLGEFMEIED